MDGIITVLIILIAWVTYQGLRDSVFQDKYIFDVDAILIRKEYFRVISSGFLHGDWIHFGFNAIALSSFGLFCIVVFGIGQFAVLYFGSLLGGSLLALYVHRNHGDYRALGASGAIFGLVFSTIVLEPFGTLTFILIPFEIPSWVMGIGLVAASIVGIKKGYGNIGHEAHLGGAIFGILFTAFSRPESFSENLWIYCLVGLPSIGFVYFIIKNPNYLLDEKIPVSSFSSFKFSSKTKKKAQPTRQEELDQILDKIAAEGMESLSKSEKDKLKRLSE